MKMASHYYPTHPPTPVALLLLGVFSAICGAMTPTNGVQFLFPTAGTTLHYNDNVQVQYTSNFSDPWLFAFCLSADGNVGQKSSESVGGYNNTATVKLDWPGSDTPCWFDLKPNSTAPAGTGANGDQWSYDVAQRAATTVGLTVSTATTSSSSTSAATSTSVGATASTSPTAAASPSNGAPGGLSTGAQAGIGIGAAVAGLCMGAAAVAVFMRRRRRRARMEAAASIEKDPAGGWMSPEAGGVTYQGDYQSVQGKASLATEMDGGYPAAQELHGVSGIQEMPARAD